jgi:hypothetical protein
MFISEEIIEQTKNEILNSREFCGNPKRAALEFLADEFGIAGADAIKAYRLANFRAVGSWNKRQIAAGVNPKYTF